MPHDRKGRQANEASSEKQRRTVSAKRLLFRFLRAPRRRTIGGMKAATPIESTDTSEAAIFSRVLQPDKPSLSPEAASSILKLDFSPADRRRMESLSAKARKGRLTPDEDRELENYINVNHLLTIMQSKARRSLRNNFPLCHEPSPEGNGLECPPASWQRMRVLPDAPGI